MGGRDYDLSELEQRHDFLAEASARGLSVLQSHLLIVDGEVDVLPQEDAPVFTRRMLFTDEAGFGLYQTGRPETLYGAARQLAEALAPRMALNLDMGSYDYCQRAEDGAEAGCGRLERDDALALFMIFALWLFPEARRKEPGGD